MEINIKKILRFSSAVSLEIDNCDFGSSTFGLGGKKFLRIIVWFNKNDGEGTKQC